MSFNTALLLTQVQMKATLPDGRYTDNEVMSVAHDVLLSQMVPLVLSLKEEYYVANESQAITINVASYPIPYKAYGLSLREVKLIDGTSIRDLYRIDPTAITSTATGTPTSFYLEGQDVVVYPTPNSTTGTLKLSYYLTPNKPVLTTASAVITNIDIATGVITATVPTTWTTSNKFDFISQRNGHKSVASGLTATSLTITTAEFNVADIPAALIIGDYISLEGEAPYLQLPDSAFGLMVQLISNEFLEDLGDAAALQAGMAKSGELKQAFISSLNVRVVGAPKRSRIRM